MSLHDVKHSSNRCKHRCARARATFAHTKNAAAAASLFLFSSLLLLLLVLLLLPFLRVVVVVVARSRSSFLDDDDALPDFDFNDDDDDDDDDDETSFQHTKSRVTLNASSNRPACKHSLASFKTSLLARSGRPPPFARSSRSRGGGGGGGLVMMLAWFSNKNGYKVLWSKRIFLMVLDRLYPYRQLVQQRI